MCTVVHAPFQRVSTGLRCDLLFSKPSRGCLGDRCGDASWAASATTGWKLSASGGAEFRPVDGVGTFSCRPHILSQALRRSSEFKHLQPLKRRLSWPKGCSERLQVASRPD